MESCFGTIKTELVHHACYPTGKLPGMTCSLTSKDITIVSGYIPPRVYHSRTGRAPSRLIRCPQNQGKVSDTQHHHHGQSDKRYSSKHRRAMRRRCRPRGECEARDDTMERHGNDDRLEKERDRGGDIEMCAPCTKACHATERQERPPEGRTHSAGHRADSDIRDEADQHQAAGKEMDTSNASASHCKVLVTKRSSTPSSEHQRGTRNSEIRKMRILATLVSNSASRTPRRQLCDVSRGARHLFAR